jgi:hypothetical protein
MPGLLGVGGACWPGMTPAGMMAIVTMSECVLVVMVGAEVRPANHSSATQWQLYNSNVGVEMDNCLSCAMFCDNVHKTPTFLPTFNA